MKSLTRNLARLFMLAIWLPDQGSNLEPTD